ncbi:MAG: hypothetical protein R3F14_27655 [Polyangiaceae bacterium]
MLATTELAPDGTPLDPADLLADATLTVVPSTSLRLRFDRFLLPATLLRQAACLRSNLADVTDFTQCEGGVFLQPAYDPVRREVVLRQPAGDRLELDTAYKLTLFVPDIEGDCTGEDPTSCGFRAFDRAPLEQAYTVTFKTVAVDPGPVPDEAPPPADFCGGDGAAISFIGCGYSPCHAPTFNGPGAAAGLDLSGLLPGDTFDSFALRATAINRVSHQTQMGERAFDPEETPARFGRAMPIIDAFDPGTAGSPGNSYLLYKLLVGPSMDSAPADIRPSDEEMARLRNGLVVGLPMSADGSKLSGDALLALSNWIARGAPTPKCQ